jgi:hypothetical protein
MSKIEVDAIDKQSGSTLTLGGSGTAVTLACGATQTGFGRTGTVDWITTPVTSTPTTGVNGKGYFVNSTGAIKTINLPASPSAGDIMAVVDYAGTAQSYNITVGRNGSNINGAASDQVISKNNSGAVFVYVDGTQGWKATETSNLNDIEAQPEFIVATGGTITTVCTDYKVHTFTGPGTFCVSCAGNPAGSSQVSYVVVAGGGAGGTNHGGGGGAGGYREGKSPQTPYTSSPITCTSGPNAGIAVTAQAYSIVVGGGAPNTPFPPGNRPGASGSNSSFSTITSAGGGGGGTNPCAGTNGGSGGGGGNSSPGFGVGNTPPVSPAQGQNGGAAGYGSPHYGMGGGGGAGGAGNVPVAASPSVGGTGGAGVSSEITGSAVTRAGGGGGSVYQGGTAGAGGAGGGGTGSTGGPSPNAANGTDGTANTGGGGGGGERNIPQAYGRAGGSGIVIIRYKFQ